MSLEKPRMVPLRDRASMNICSLCQRKKVRHGQRYCSRCISIMEKTGKVSDSSEAMKNIICGRCRRRLAVPSFYYCERCQILIERETGEKAKSFKELIEEVTEEQKKIKQAEELPKKLCKGCERREPVENSEYCERCVVLIAQGKTPRKRVIKKESDKK